MDKLRIDQSHCNYYLSRWLQSQGGKVLFTDAGRVSRGGTGTQGLFLNIFESNRLHIPDIAALLNDELLLIEIDTTISKASKSLISYQENVPLIKTEIVRFFPTLTFCAISRAFCFTGLKKQTFLKSIKEVPAPVCEILFIFLQERTPTLIDLRTSFLKY